MAADILIIMAMEAEAAPLKARMGLSDAVFLHEKLPAFVLHGVWSGAPVRLVCAGTDERFGVDCIGTVPAALTAWAACEANTPKVIISAGTAGGVGALGAAVGDVYLSRGPVVFHDRRVPLGAFEAYGVGSFRCMDCTAMASKLGLKSGTFTTGDSLDLSAADAAALQASGAVVKDMESAAVAWAAQRRGIPFVGVRAITDLADGPHHVGEEFARNLEAASARLADALPRVVGELATKYW